MKSSHPLEQDELMAYLDGELRPELATVAAVHLERCAECRVTAAEMRELSQQLAAWEIQMSSPEVPAAISSAVDAHVKTQKKRTAEHRRSWQQVLGAKRIIWAGGLVAVLLIVSIPNFFTAMKGRVAGEREQFTESFWLRRSKPLVPPGTAQGRAADGGFGNDNYAPGRGALGKLQKDENDNGKLDSITTVTNGPLAPDEGEQQEQDPSPTGPMIVRTAQLSLTTKDFENARASAEEIVKRHGGYIGELGVNAPAGSGRTLNATFRVPAAQLDATIAELKKLGRVEAENQGGEEVTQQYVDLDARLANARHTEKRLSDLLSQRTGKLSDVLAFEKEIDRVRGEIESMEAQRKSMAKQVTYATLSTTMSEVYTQQLQLPPPSTSTRLRNAAVEGYRNLAGGLVSLILFLLSAGPSLLIWGGLLFVVGRLIWKRIQRRIA